MSIAWGLLWYDEDGSLDDKVRRALERYQEKYGSVPDTCFVHPSETDAVLMVDECKVIAHPTVLKHHLWIGEGI